MHDPAWAQRLHALEKSQYNGAILSDSDEGFLYEVLSAGDASDEMRFQAGVILTGDDPALSRLFDKFESLPSRSQRILVPLLCGLDTYPPYKMLLRFLKSTLSESMAEWVILCLVRSKYPLAVPVIAAVADKDVLYHRRIKKLIGAMGLTKLGPFLAMMPEVPHSQVYREIFGDEAFRRLRARRK